MSAFLLELAAHCAYGVCQKRPTTIVFDTNGRFDGCYCKRHGAIRVNGLHAFERSLVVKRAVVA